MQSYCTLLSMSFTFRSASVSMRNSARSIFCWLKSRMYSWRSSPSRMVSISVYRLTFASGSGLNLIPFSRLKCSIRLRRTRQFLDKQRKLGLLCSTRICHLKFMDQCGFMPQVLNERKKILSQQLSFLILTFLYFY